MGQNFSGELYINQSTKPSLSTLLKATHRCPLISISSLHQLKQLTVRTARPNSCRRMRWCGVRTVSQHTTIAVGQSLISVPCMGARVLALSLSVLFSIETSELAPALNCTYCHLEIRVGEPSVACKRCNAMHHQDCWAERGRCAVYGCGHRRKADRSPIDRYPGSRDPWQKPILDDSEFIYIDFGKSLWGWLKDLFRSG